MGLFHVGVVVDGALVGGIEELWGGKALAATLAGGERMASDHLVADRDDAHVLTVAHVDHLGGAEVGAGAAAHAAALHRNDILLPVAQLELERGRADDLPAHTHAQPAADTAVGRRLDGQIELSRELEQARALRCEF